jgi:hypothetical protein
MKHLRKFLRLPTADQWFLIKVILLLETIKLGMRLLPFRILRHLLARVADAAPARLRHPGHPSADRIAWALEVASRHTPGAKSCLTQALAAQVLLARRGYPALLRIGVAKGEREQFQAHAWVESEGNVVIGGSEQLGRYTPLAVLAVEGDRGPRDLEALAKLP